MQPYTKCFDWPRFNSLRLVRAPSSVRIVPRRPSPTTANSVRMASSLPSPPLDPKAQSKRRVIKMCQIVLQPQNGVPLLCFGIYHHARRRKTNWYKTRQSQERNSSCKCFGMIKSQSDRTIDFHHRRSTWPSTRIDRWCFARTSWHSENVRWRASAVPHVEECRIGPNVVGLIHDDSKERIEMLLQLIPELW